MLRLALVLSVMVAVADARPRVDNMPRGFVWPPSRAMLDAARRCEQKLDELGVTWKPASREGRMVDAIALPDATIGGVAYTNVYDKGPVVMDCQLVLALATFAPHLWELGVREVRVGSVYRWSKVRVGGKTKPLLSRHALGLAMDVVSFVDADGREAVVGKDYKQGDELLLSIEHAIDDTTGFRTVLTPTNDPVSHKDHFHIEANPDYTEDRPQS